MLERERERERERARKRERIDAPGKVEGLSCGEKRDRGRKGWKGECNGKVVLAAGKKEGQKGLRGKGSRAPRQKCI